MRKPDYGLDAPVMQKNLVIVGVVFILAVFYWPKIGFYVMWAGIALLACAIWIWYGSRTGKVRLAKAMVEELPWRGDEQVLDVGCGHGLLAVFAAKKLKTGKSVGVDIWREFDQSGNKPERVLDNARIEGVGRFVEVKDGDARELPYPDETFDTVLSGWCIHNIAVGTGREKAIREMVRVLKPGGWIGILDIEITKELVAFLHKCGLGNVQKAGPSFVFIAPTHRLIAQKPAATESA